MARLRLSPERAHHKVESGLRRHGPPPAHNYMTTFFLSAAASLAPRSSQPISINPITAPTSSLAMKPADGIDAMFRQQLAECAARISAPKVLTLRSSRIFRLGTIRLRRSERGDVSPDGLGIKADRIHQALAKSSP